MGREARAKRSAEKAAAHGYVKPASRRQPRQMDPRQLAHVQRLMQILAAGGRADA